MKGRILDILRQADSVVSGEVISDRLGISRVSVWKHVKGLKALGYDIRSAPRGYRLVRSPDVPYPWEVSKWADRMHYFSETTSTMDTARELARKGCPHFTVVSAGRQTAGKGRLKRKWLSAEGGLYFTVVVRPQIPVLLSPRVNFSASLTLARTLRDACRVDAKVKWPNDVFVDGKKIAGILSEMEADSDRVAFINVGIGVNVNNDVREVDPPAVSLREILGRDFSKKVLLGEFLDRYEKALTSDSLQRVITDWKALTITLNRQVKIVTLKDTVTGTAVDVDENGELIVKLPDGSLQRVVYGDCFHV